MAGDSALEQWLTWAFSPTISTVLVTLLVVILSPILLHFYIYRKERSKELPSLLLLGPSGGGKTSLLTLVCILQQAERPAEHLINTYLQFANNTPSPTHTSQAPQTALCRLPNTVRSHEDRFRSENDRSEQPQFLLIDTPGHGKLRHHALTTLTNPSALKGLIYVLDSAAISSSASLTETAEYLHDILLLLQKRHTQAKSSKDPNAIPVLVAANKQDVFSSLPVALVKSKLEEEIAKVRETRSKGLLDSGIGMEEGGGDEEVNWLGEYGAREFRFKQMEEHGVDVKLVGGNVRGEGEEGGVVKDWWAWIGENM
jgi:signal recognition particle receptor subunit beta